MVRIVIGEEVSRGTHAYDFEIHVFLILPLAPFDYMADVRVCMPFEHKGAPLSNNWGA
jgi:hypothetical protein